MLDRHISRRRLLPLGCAALLAACGGRPAPAAPTTAPTPTAAPVSAPATREPVTVSWSYWGDDKEVEINERIISAFQAVEPLIKITTVHEPWTSYFSKITASWARQESPDVMFLNNVPIYARSGALENLEPYIARDRYNVADFYPMLLETFRLDGHLYGLPRDNDTKVIYFNRRLFEEANLSAPEPNWTWEQLRQAALKLTRRDSSGKATRFGFSYEVSNWWRIWVWQNNGDILDDHFKPTRVRLDEPAAIEAIRFLADLTNQDKATPGYEQLNSDAQRALFRDSAVAMIMDNHTFIPTIAETPGVTWDIAPLPRKARAANLAGGAGYVLSTWSQQKDAAWTFFKFLEGPEGQALFAEAGVAVPARRSIREENIFYRRQPYSFNVFFDETERGVHNYYFPKLPGSDMSANEMNVFLDQRLEPVWRGGSANEIVPSIAAELRQRLKLA